MAVEPTRDSQEMLETGLSWLTPEDRSDKTTVRWAWFTAVALHAVLLVIQFPELAATEPPPPPEQKVYVVEQVRFKQPPPPPEQELPELRSPIPIPDPTPHEPELIRDIPEVQPQVDLPPDLIIDIPEGPPPAFEEPTGPLPVGGDVSAPVKIYHPLPSYTEVARRAGVEGVVVLRAVVDKNGDVVDAKILRGLSFGLDQEALRTVRTWKYEPATLNGKPVAVFISVTARFSLQ